MSILPKASSKSCLLVAHGSRLETSNDEVRKLAQLLSDINQAAIKVDCAFLEIAEPSIGGGLQRLIAGGASDIVVLPYFLASGRHVSRDIPEQVDAVRQQFPDISIRITAHIGAHPGVAKLLLGQLTESD